MLVRRRHARISNPRHESFQITLHTDRLDRTERFRGASGSKDTECIIDNARNGLRMRQKNSMLRDKTVRFCRLMANLYSRWQRVDEGSRVIQVDLEADDRRLDL